MSVVKKLTLQGIRSFDPNDSKQQMIEFQTPLTLILGVNGSGKTTIIESLKYAITNTFPPNCNKGASFVNDPKLGNGYETMGIVRLDVDDSQGNTYCIVRKIKATVKDKLGNLTKKELDATIKVKKADGTVTELSSKCNDTKVEMCRIMGVSEAILNNVILCHQEDSCWPLDEGKKVKEKFDAIFNTTMYIKCLDQLTKQDKELGQKAKSEKEKLGFVIENRKMARQKRKELEDKQVELAAVTDKINKLQKEVYDMESRLKIIQEAEKEFTEFTNKMSQVEGKLDMVQKQILEIKKSMKEELQDDISSLKQKLSESTGEFKEKTAQQKQLISQSRTNEHELRKLEGQQKALLLEEGKFQQEESAQKKRLAHVTSLIAEIRQLLIKLKQSSQDISFTSSLDAVLEVCEDDPQDLSLDVVVRALASAIRARESEISKTKIQHEKEEKELQRNIDDLRIKKASIEKEIEMKMQQNKENASSISELKSRLRAIEGCTDTLTELKEDEAKISDDIAKIKSGKILENCEADLKNFIKEIKELDGRISKAADDEELLTNDKSTLDHIALFSKQKLQKQNESNEIMRRIADDLTSVLGEIPKDKLGDTFDKKKAGLTRELFAKKNEQKALEKEFTIHDTKLTQLKTELNKKTSKADDLKAKITDILDEQNFNDMYEDVKTQLDVSQKDLYHAEAAEYLYKKFVQKLKKKSCCPLCERDMETKQATQDLINKLLGEGKMEELKSQYTAKVEDLKTKEQDLLRVKPLCEEFSNLEQEIPALKQKVENLQSKYNEISVKLEDLNSTIEVLECDKSILEKCSNDVGLYENAKKEIVQRADSIAKLERSRDKNAKELSQKTNLSDLQTLLKDLRSSLKAKQMEKDSKSDTLNKKRTELNNMVNEKNQVRERILQITAELQNREAIEVQKKDLEDSNKQLLETITSLKSELPSTKTLISEAESEKTACSDRKEKHLQTLRLQNNEIEKNKSKLSELIQQIHDFEKKKAEFSDVQKKTDDCKQKLHELNDRKKEIDSEMEAIKTSIVNHETCERNIKDNLAYKEKLAEAITLQTELDNKRKVLQSSSNKGMATERRELLQSHQTKSAKMNQHLGEKKGFISAISDLKKDLNERMYANAEEQYLEKLVKKSVYEKAQKDLRRYKTALDQAIMNFHKKRMEMINKTLREYWRKIYRGNDIDYIQIRTEAGSGQSAAGTKVKIDTGKGRKNYNYRVVMIRRGIELDMRGRCSAGQRVLACIIIRIALAESFNSRCGMITLDEPTTNLDAKNINSLADALSSLADKMSQSSEQKNFQLIVITHDQEFTDRLSSIDAVEKYWRVSRDQNGYSKIAICPKRG